jgi:hypothetical protein
MEAMVAPPEEKVGIAGPETVSEDPAEAIEVIFAVAEARLSAAVTASPVTVFVDPVDHLSAVIAALEAVSLDPVDHLSAVIAALEAVSLDPVDLLSAVIADAAALETTIVPPGWRACCEGSIRTETALSSRMKYLKKENACSASWPSEQALRSTARSRSRSFAMRCLVGAAAETSRKNRTRDRNPWSPGSG